MRLRTLVLCLSLGTLTYAAPPLPFPLADIPILIPSGAPQIGRGPDGKTATFTAPSNSTTLDLKQYRGKAVVLTMISLTCGHCVTAVQFLIELQKQYGPEGLQVVGVAGGEQVEFNLPQWLQRFRPNFPVGYLAKDPYLKLAGLPADGRPFVPIVLFVDPKGMVRYRSFGNDPEMKNTEQALLQNTRTLLAQSAPLLKK